jgi:hypothetical protein
LKRILWLSNSEDVSPEIPEEKRSWRLAAGMVQTAINEEIEIVPRVIWPDPKLADIIDGWMVRYEPDLVLFKVNAYWYLYKSVPLRIRRRFKRLGGRIAAGGERVGRIPWFTKTRAFHWSRAILLRTVGGDTQFPPEHVAALTEECVKRILRDEGRRVIVNTTLDHWTSNPKPQAQVHRRLKAFCESVHCGYLGADIEHDPPPPDLYSTGDRLHTDEAGHRWQSEKLAAALIREFQR